jgi:hypothetical protein
MAEDDDWIATDAKSVLGPTYRAARERKAALEREPEPEHEPEPERHPELLGLMHLLVREWTAETAPQDGIIGHPVVLEDGTLSEEAAECSECHTRFEACGRGESVEWPSRDLSERRDEQSLGDPLWLCPSHGKSTVKISQKTGRAYRGCPDCHAFVRPGVTASTTMSPPGRALTALADAMYAHVRDEREKEAASPESETDWRPPARPTGAAALVTAGLHLHGPGRCDDRTIGRCIYPGLPRMALSDGEQAPLPERHRVLSKDAAVAAAVAVGIHLHGPGDCVYADGINQCIHPGLSPSAFSDWDR